MSRPLSPRVEAMIAKFATEVAAREPRLVSIEEIEFWRRWDENKARQATAKAGSGDLDLASWPPRLVRRNRP